MDHLDGRADLPMLLGGLAMMVLALAGLVMLPLLAGRPGQAASAPDPGQPAPAGAGGAIGVMREVVGAQAPIERLASPTPAPTRRTVGHRPSWVAACDAPALSWAPTQAGPVQLARVLDPCPWDVRSGFA